jgi:hypothetical protein
MPKDIYSRREELICGKIDLVIEMIKKMTGNDTKRVMLLYLLESIQHDANRMESKLIEYREGK